MRYAYESKPVSDEVAEFIGIVRAQFSGLEQMIDAERPKFAQNKRYLAIAKTHLETAAMFAIKSLTHVDTQ